MQQSFRETEGGGIQRPGRLPVLDSTSFCRSPAPDPRTPPPPDRAHYPRPIWLRLRPQNPAPPGGVTSPSLPEPRPPGLAQVARVSLPTPWRSRVLKGRATPALRRPRPPGSVSAPWPRRDPAPYGLRSVAAAAASSCVPSSLWLVTRALHPSPSRLPGAVGGWGAGGEFSTCVRGWLLGWVEGDSSCVWSPVCTYRRQV